MSDIDKAILFLVCPQRDFVDPVEPDAKVNALHVGPLGVRKLRGDRQRNEPDRFVETVHKFYEAERAGTDRVSVVLDEDWHPKSCAEFDIFGEHCVKGSSGAKLAGDLEKYRWHPATHVIRANSINPAADPAYTRILKNIVGNTKVDGIRCGVAGVWTHVKVEYMCIALQTLWPCFKHIAVCEPLCASPKAEDHSYAIQKLR
jgi:nicotinamidase-related amidase